MPASLTDRLRDMVQRLVARTDGNPAAFGDEDNLLEAGYIDSTGFFDLIAMVEEELDITVDFLEADPADLVSIAGLARHLDGQCESSPG